MFSLFQFLRSTVFTKIVMAVTGLMIVGFLAGHLLGNLLMFSGPEKINAYAFGLKSLGPLLWIVRLTLISALGLHVWSSIKLSNRNRAARPIAYQEKKSLKSSFASRTMMYSGLAILFFVIYHLLHYTFGLIQPQTYFDNSYTLTSGEVVHNVFNMVVAGFQNPFIALSYLFAIIFVSAHISHSVSSAFRTLGIHNPKYLALTSRIGPALAAIFLIGYLSIPIAVFSGIIKPACDNTEACAAMKDCCK